MFIQERDRYCTSTSKRYNGARLFLERDQSVKLKQKVYYERKLWQVYGSCNMEGISCSKADPLCRLHRLSSVMPLWVSSYLICQEDK